MIKNFLIIKYNDGIFKVLEVSKKRNKLYINNWLSFELIDKDNPLPEIKKRFQENNINFKKVIILTSSPEVKNEIKAYPRMPSKDLKTVVEREVKKSFTTDNFFFDYLIAEEIDSRKRSENKVLISMADENHIWDVFTFIRNLEKTPYAITSKHQNDLLLRTFIKEEDKTIGFLNIRPKRSCFILLKENSNIILEREIHTSEAPVFETSNLENILMEINRSIQYFKQKNRGYDVSKIYVVSSFENPEQIIDILNTRLPFEISLLPVDRVKNLVKIGIPENEYLYFISEYCELIGLIFLPYQKEMINLLPSYYFEKEIYRKRINSFIITIAIILFLLISSTFFIENLKHNASNEFEKQKKALNKLSSRVNEINQIKNTRKIIYQEMETLLREPKSLKNIVLFFNYLTLNTPQNVNLYSASIEKDLNNWRVSLEGVILSNSSFLNNEIFKDYYQKIGLFPDTIETDFSINQYDNSIGKRILNQVSKTVSETFKKLKNSPGQSDSENKILKFKIDSNIKNK